MATIDEFKASVSIGGGLALQNRYKVLFNFPAGIVPARADGAGDTQSHFDILCDSATIPARVISTFDYQAQKQSYKIANGYALEDVSFTFLLTNDYMVKDVFDKWTESIIDFDNYRMNYRENYTATVDVLQMNTSNQAIYGCTLYGAYPTGVSAIALENSAENTIQRLTVSMAYENFSYELYDN